MDIKQAWAIMGQTGENAAGPCEGEPPDDLPEWPHNALRHTHASVHVASGGPLESLTFGFGHSGGAQVLKSHYVGVMPKAEAAKIMKIRPK